MGSDPIKKRRTPAKNENTLHNLRLYIMPKAVDRNVFSDFSYIDIFMKKILYSSMRNVCVGIIFTVKKPFFRAIGYPVCSEYIEIGC